MLNSRASPPAVLLKFAFFAFMKKDESAPTLTDDQILAASHRYSAVLSKIDDLFSKAGDDLISGTPATVYLKRMGHRQLSTEDVANLIKGVGSDEDKQAFAGFEKAQRAMTQRIKIAKAKGVILAQAEITQPEWRKRQETPSVWKPEQINQVIDVLKRIRV